MLNRYGDILKDKRIIIFHSGSGTAGGSWRVAAEEAKYFERSGAKVYILVSDLQHRELLSKTLKANIEAIGGRVLESKSYLRKAIRYPQVVLALRKKIKEINPSIIISRNAFQTTYVYFATLFSPFPYVAHIHETVSWGDEYSPRQGALIYRKAFKEIKRASAGCWEFDRTRRKTNLMGRILSELAAAAEYLAVRKARKIFVLSNQTGWEVARLYGRESVVLRGGFPSQMLNYQPRENIKEKLGLLAKRVVLSVSRLTLRKRVALLIEAFKKVSDKFPDVILIVGGTGPEENNLRNLAKELDAEDKIKFVGYIPEEQLWDYYAGCDLFVSLDRAEFDITPYEALALWKKVVLSTEMELDGLLAQNRHIFVAEPAVSSVARAVEEALNTEIADKNDLSDYTWDAYCEKLTRELSPFIRGGH